MPDNNEALANQQVFLFIYMFFIKSPQTKLKDNLLSHLPYAKNYYSNDNQNFCNDCS